MQTCNNRNVKLIMNDLDAMVKRQKQHLKNNVVALKNMEHHTGILEYVTAAY